jgi:hypothetical protein
VLQVLRLAGRQTREDVTLRLEILKLAVHLTQINVVISSLIFEDLILQLPNLVPLLLGLLLKLFVLRSENVILLLQGLDLLLELLEAIGAHSHCIR